MKKGYEVVGTFNFWLGVVWMVFGIFALVGSKLETPYEYYSSFSVGVLFWLVAGLEVNGKYLKDIRDSLGEK